MVPPYAKFAEQHLETVSEYGSERMCRCVVHEDSKASMQFNVQTGLWVCFACHAGGSYKSLCKAMGLPVGRDQPSPADIDDVLRLLDKVDQPVKILSESTLEQYRFPNDYWTKERHLSPFIIKRFNLGFDPMVGCAIIPLRNTRGQLLGVIKRYLNPDMKLRYLYPAGFKRSDNLFGSWLIDQHPSHQIVLTEGSIDAMKVWQAGIPAVAQYGSSISPNQINLLRKLGARSVVLFYDNDQGGKLAVDSATGMTTHTRQGKPVQQYVPDHDLRRYFQVSRVKYPPVAGKSDPGAMTSKQIKHLVDQAVPLI